MAKLTDEQRQEIAEYLRVGWYTQSELARKYGVSTGMIRYIMKRVSGLNWRYSRLTLTQERAIYRAYHYIHNPLASASQRERELARKYNVPITKIIPIVKGDYPQ